MKLTAKINAIILISILCLAGVGIAGTAYFDNRADALAALNDTITITKGKCTVLEVTETIDSEGSKGIIARIQVEFYKPNLDRRINKVIVSSTNQATIEAETKKPCNDLWLAIQAEPQFQRVDTVVVEYHEGVLADILNREYDLDKKTWGNKTAVQAG